MRKLHHPVTTTTPPAPTTTKPTTTFIPHVLTALGEEGHTGTAMAAAAAAGGVGSNSSSSINSAGEAGRSSYPSTAALTHVPAPSRFPVVSFPCSCGQGTHFLGRKTNLCCSDRSNVCVGCLCCCFLHAWILPPSLLIGLESSLVSTTLHTVAPPAPAQRQPPAPCQQCLRRRRSTLRRIGRCVRVCFCI